MELPIESELSSITSHAKPKLDVGRQIQAMRANGVRFDIMSEAEAAVFLTNANYLFKVKAFDKDFDRRRPEPGKSPGPYLNLDFAYLLELSKLDRHLRSFVLSACLDIEHFMKVSVNRAMMDDPECDGYDAVQRFFEFRRNQAIERMLTGIQRHVTEADVASLLAATRNLTQAFNEDNAFTDIEPLLHCQGLLTKICDGIDPDHAVNSLRFLSDSCYSRGLASKYGDPTAMAAWNYVEMASFGDLIAFYKYYFLDYHKNMDGWSVPQEAKATKKLLFPTKTLRNAAAHNDCILNSLKQPLKKPVGDISKALIEKYGMEREPTRSTRAVPFIHDLSALLITYDIIVPTSGARDDCAHDLMRLSDRFSRHSEYFLKQGDLSQALLFVRRLTLRFSRVLSGQAKE